MTTIGQSSIVQTRQFRDIALLLAAASALTESPSLIDRMANALNPEPAMRAVKDALRTIDSELSQPTGKRRIEINLPHGDQKERPSILIRTEKGSLRLQGYLPSNENVLKFLEDVYVDSSLARRIGSLASAMLVDAKLRSEAREG